ncbi:hypothetical protein ACEZDF_21595 [Vibrio alginolyticus]|uniref:hypothetical protein n=1 Tax=Vibrio alginolyticus TaxID=663 RepID=UPI0035C0BBB4
MSWITLTSVTATNGQKVVAVNSGSTANIKIGDALKIGAFDIYEIEGVFADQLSLREPWGNATQTAAKAVVVPTFGDFNAAVTAMRDLADVASGNLTAIEDWGTKAGEVTFTGKDGATYTARTLQQMDDDVAAIERQALEIARTGALEALIAISGGKWVLVTDDFGNAQCVRRVPIHTFEDLNISGCPFTGPLDCFIRQDGSYRPYVDVAVYQASSKGGKAASQADKDPWTFISADTARARCAELNANSMMMSQEVWAMLCWNMISQGFQPRGNTEYGRSHSNKNEFGRRADGRVPDDRSGDARTLTGSGPESWRHDGTIFGVADMVGNAWEWVDGMKMVSGQFIVAEYTGQPEAEWLATGVYISETGQFTSVAPSTLNSGSQVWGGMPKASGYAGNERLQRLMIEPIACTSVLSGRFYWNLDGERFPLRGGRWLSASNAGPAALNCSDPRSNTNSGIGFRSAFVS